jgi:hypothetical protein
MPFFDRKAPDRSPENARIYAAFEVARTVNDFAAALFFLIGSILFFWESTQTFATWLFVLGSLCFALKPTLRLIRELRYVEEGAYDQIARGGD